MTVIDWLLDADPAIRWQVMQDLLDEHPDAVAAERARVAHEGWGGRLLALQDENGKWAGGTHFPVPMDDSPGQPWTATSFSLQQLRHFGVDPADPVVRSALDRVRDNNPWEYDGSAFFDGEVEACINGMALGIGAYFGEDVRVIADRLVTETLDDGGWNCEVENGSTRSSFNSTLSVLEGLLQFEQANGATPETTKARASGEEYLLKRHLMRRLSTGEVPVPGWLQFTYPPRYRYDVLRALDYFRAADVRDERMSEAVDLVVAKRPVDGRWLLENSLVGAMHFELEDGDGRPSRWNTLRAMRVLEWWG